MAKDTNFDDVFEKVNFLDPPSKAEVARACFKDIDKRTDRILALTRSVEIERQVDLLWDSVLQLYHLHNWEEDER